MKTLTSFLKEFAVFNIDSVDDNEIPSETDDIEFSLPSQDDTVSDEKDFDVCPCCGKPKSEHDEDGKLRADKNIEVIEPEEGEYDIEREDGDEDSESGDPMKDYDLF